MVNLEELEVCPIELSVNLISKKWTILIIRDIFFGKKHFNEFKANKPDLSNKVLSRCLKQMENDGLIKKIASSDNVKNTEYELTHKGEKLNKILFELAMYSITLNENNKFFDDDLKKEMEDLFIETLNID